MKTEQAIDPAAAFPDEKLEPDDDSLKTALGAAFAPIAEILAAVRTSYPDVTPGWQYSQRSGWYRLALQQKRRLFYLIPKQGDFSLMFLLGGKALASLETTPHAKTVARLLKTAKRWPEGTEFRFDASTCDPSLVSALIAAKIAH